MIGRLDIDHTVWRLESASKCNSSETDFGYGVLVVFVVNCMVRHYDAEHHIAKGHEACVSM